MNFRMLFNWILLEQNNVISLLGYLILLSLCTATYFLGPGEIDDSNFIFLLLSLISLTLFNSSITKIDENELLYLTPKLRIKVIRSLLLLIIAPMVLLAILTYSYFYLSIILVLLLILDMIKNTRLSGLLYSLMIYSFVLFPTEYSTNFFHPLLVPVTLLLMVLFIKQNINSTNWTDSHINLTSIKSEKYFFDTTYFFITSKTNYFSKIYFSSTIKSLSIVIIFFDLIRLLWFSDFENSEYPYPISILLMACITLYINSEYFNNNKKYLAWHALLPGKRKNQSIYLFIVIKNCLRTFLLLLSSLIIFNLWHVFILENNFSYQYAINFFLIHSTIFFMLFSFFICATTTTQRLLYMAIFILTFMFIGFNIALLINTNSISTIIILIECTLSLMLASYGFSRIKKMNWI